ncbi:MAG TPA: GNAT family N-acetyltransferase [Solirubrobacteraceae bacterium]|nr:GNAT family N-acetyltransferase [Solirubrobacteraceae bacterium]
MRASDLDRIVAHLCAIEDAVAQRTELLPWGTAVYHPGVPWVREVNVVRVETTGRSVTAAELAHAARERFPALPAVEVLHEPLGAGVAPRFAAAGWRVSRHVLMALLEPPPAPALDVEEVPLDEVWPLREEWLRTEPWGTAGAVTTMLDWERARAQLTGARAFCARDGGRPVSMCLLLATDHADEIERVYTTPSHRGRGLARAVVAHAAREAGGQLTFLFTDAHGAAQHLYARLGFRRQWIVYRFATEEQGRARRTG